MSQARSHAEQNGRPVLEVCDLATCFHTDRGLVRAVDGVSLEVRQGEIVGLVGESGCGKTVTMLSSMQLLRIPPAVITGGQVLFEGDDLLRLERRSERMCSIRGRQIAMIFQEPMSSLNPVLTVGRQLTEMLERHLKMGRREAAGRAIELLQMVGVADAKSRLHDYPHQFSGGMRQRVMIAMAMSCNPRVIIADEPTTALDVTTQAQLLELLVGMVTSAKTSLIIVTHNLGIVARYVDRIYVMYAGRVVESGASEVIFRKPGHPYTLGLLQSVPRLDQSRGKRKLVPIDGVAPSLIDLPPTCAFMPRCMYKTALCEQEPWPPLAQVGDAHSAACRLDQWGRQ